MAVRDRRLDVQMALSHTSLRPTTPSGAKRRIRVSMSPRIFEDLAHFTGWGEEQSSKSVHSGEPDPSADSAEARLKRPA